MKELNISGIYSIKNIITNSYYVGSAVCIKKRIIIHKSHLKTNKHCNKKLQRSYNKYGHDKFIFNVIEEVDNKELLIEREQHWIESLDSVKNGYNILPVAGSCLGRKHTEETKIKMSISALGVKKNPESVAKQAASLRGRKQPEDQKKKQIAAQTGKKHTTESRLRMSIAQKGKIMSEQAKINMSKAQKGKKLSEETKKKISIFHKGRVKSKEEILKCSISRTGAKRTIEARKLMAMSGAISWAKKANRPFSYVSWSENEKGA
jgi:group I intron endonuclease